jgi:tetratricopeptide (TPR) repeat protein
VRHIHLAAAVLLVCAPPLAAQKGPPDSLVNTLVIPRNTPVPEVITRMRGITLALGVRCTHCHVGTEAMNIWDYDFVSDEKPTKRKAREMMRMVNAINGEYLTRLADLDAEGVEVTCMTCHRGVRIPQPLSDVLLRAHAEGGLAGMDASYDTLRQQYYGRASYDFGELTLDRVAEVLLARGRSDDAIRTYQRNVELFGSSAFVRRQLAKAQLEVGDTAAAVAAYREALAVNPRDRQVRRALEELGATP